MSLSMYQAFIPPLIRTFDSLMGVLNKGEAYAQAKTIDPVVLLNSRLYPDMFPLSRQIQIASDVARRGAARLAGVEAPSLEDNEASFAELTDRLQTTITYLETFSATQIEGTEEKEITFPIGGGQTATLQGMPYLLSFVIPNVYFHVTTAYDILRHNGVEIGKRDFLGEPPQ